MRKAQESEPRIKESLDDRVWLSMPQVAAYFGTGREQVRRWIICGRLKAVRIGKLVRISRSEIADFEHRYEIGGAR